MISRTKLCVNLLRSGIGFGPIFAFMELYDPLRDCRTVLDVGCGAASRLNLLQCQHLAGIDGYAPSVAEAKKNSTHNELVLGDIRELDTFFKPGQFEACIAIDVIEHLNKEDGVKLMQAMERIASRKVVFFTPSGFLPQAHASNDDLQEHLSGWEAGEMRDFGYRVTGVLGPKWLRGQFHQIRWRPRFFWNLVSWALHLVWARWRPSSAVALLCVKDKGGARTPAKLTSGL